MAVERIVYSVILCLVTIVATAGIELPDFFPFGPQAGDQSLPPSNDASAIVNLQQPIHFYGESRNHITVHTDGHLDLLSTLPSSMATSASVYVFFSDVDTRSVGNIFYRESNETFLLQQFSQMLQLYFSTPLLPPVSVFIATWFYVGYFDNHDDKDNTFQCILGTDGTSTFAVLLYADGLIEWTTGDADGGINGLGGDPADVGFVGDSGSNPFFLPGSNTSNIIDIDSSSNVGLPGVWVFQVDEDTISQPDLDQCALGLDNCDPNAQCLDQMQGFVCICNPGFSGDGTTCIDRTASGSESENGSGSGDESPLNLDSCVAAGFTGCCVLSDCGVGPQDNRCSCDMQCFSARDCCPDIADVPCLPNFQIGFRVDEYTVREDAGFVSVDVVSHVIGVMWPQDLNINETLHVILYTSNGSAQANYDYEEVIEVLPFTGKGRKHVIIPIIEDTAVENEEFFFTHLITTDDFVQLGNESARIVIKDNDVLLTTGSSISLATTATSEITTTIPSPSATFLTSSTATPGTNSSSPPGGKNKSSINVPVIASTVGVVVLLISLLAIAILIWILRKKNKKQRRDGDTMVIDNPVYGSSTVILGQPSTTLLQDRAPHNLRLSGDRIFEDVNTLSTEPTGVIVNESASAPQRYITISEFIPEEGVEHSIELQEGQEVEMLVQGASDRGWWWVRTTNSATGTMEEGWVSSAFLVPVENCTKL